MTWVRLTNATGEDFYEVEEPLDDILGRLRDRFEKGEDNRLFITLTDKETQMRLVVNLDAIAVIGEDA